MAIASNRINHALLAEEIQEQQLLKRQTNLARIVAEESYREGLAEGERIAAARLGRGRSP